MRSLVVTCASLALAAVSLAACGARGSSNDISKDSTAVSAVSPVLSTAPAGSGAVSDPVISLERQTCYGRCPAYLVQLFADGTVRFEGRQHVPVAGVQQARIDAADVRALQQRFEDDGFAGADSSYAHEGANCGQYFADGPQFTLSARIGARRTVVHLDSGCTAAPRFLTSLAAAVDSVARTHIWLPPEGASR